MAKADIKLFHKVIKQRIQELQMILESPKVKFNYKLSLSNKIRLAEVKEIYARFYDEKKKRLEAKQ